ncbi:response regulator transcription factor [uncultured Vagococcus sp.]|uniref:response regulator transcription factor n=1 Tax=uncultured Vagococcus sp. TaxID=189676 RepID=UPI0028D0AB34|nr:response regulator transcription factor [uncultured Vagococcus sp.]
MKILIVDDEPKILEIVKAYLTASNYEVIEACNGLDALKALTEEPDLVVLDLMLPDLSGLDVCRRLRQQSNVPIIMLTAKSAEEDILTGLKVGADDYLVKPFSPKELVARIGTVLRRVNPVLPTALLFKDLIIQPETRQVFLDETEVNLTATEFTLLETLAKRPHQLFTREQLIEQIKGDDFDGFDRAIDSHIKNLRQKLGDNPRKPTYIMTVHGSGYRFGCL